MERLPEQLQLELCRYLDVGSVLALSHTAKRLQLDNSQPNLWRCLAAHHKVDMPGVRLSSASQSGIGRADGGNGGGARASGAPVPASRRGTRSLACPKRTFFVRWSQQRRSHAYMCDQVLSALYEQFRSGGRDSAASSRALLRAYPGYDVDHRHTVLEGNTALNLAARCSAVCTLKMLVTSCGADVTIADDGGFTPLANAAWVGCAKAVAWLLSQPTCTLALITTPAASLGEGPFTAEQWAARRGRDRVARMIRDRTAQLQALLPIVGVENALAAAPPAAVSV
jgi:hypothetical protein